MCGIVGVVDFTRQAKLKCLERMTGALSHRGPDDQGTVLFEANGVKIGLGHRRLSIIDLSVHGHQPMTFRNLTIVYNGEVYNYKQIRRELRDLGYRFDSDSDTEVVLKAYHKWREHAVHRFNGMFAFCVYDTEKGRLQLFRDRAGVKPLYWSFTNGVFLFASELKSLHEHPAYERKINREAAGLYFKHGYIPEPYSIFDATFKLQAAHSLTLDIKTKRTHISRYWDIVEFYNRPKTKVSAPEAIEETARLITSACRLRLEADVPVGMFLSGGYDSSTVAALLQKESSQNIKTFTIGFTDPTFDEAPAARKIAAALGTDHTEHYVSQRDVEKIVTRIPFIWDEPLADPSIIPTALVSEVAKNEVGVSLSADGGDELFAGYNKYRRSLRLASVINKVPYASRLGAALSFVQPDRIPVLKSMPKVAQRYRKTIEAMSVDNLSEIMGSLSGIFTQQELDRLLVSGFRSVETNFSRYNEILTTNNDVEKLLAIDFQTYQLDNILPKVDRATMAVGLEGREPLLDFRLVEWVAQLDPTFKLRDGEEKWLLKNICHNYLPKALMDRPKKGFGIPVERVLKGQLRSLVYFYLNEERLRTAGLYNVEYVVKLRDQFYAGLNVNPNQLWALLIFEMWREEWV